MRAVCTLFAVLTFAQVASANEAEIGALIRTGKHVTVEFMAPSVRLLVLTNVSMNLLAMWFTGINVSYVF